MLGCETAHCQELDVADPVINPTQNDAIIGDMLCTGVEHIGEELLDQSDQPGRFSAIRGHAWQGLAETELGAPVLAVDGCEKLGVAVAQRSDQTGQNLE